ncbi:MAG TPA: IclR family transcriptional regulator [Aestuariivirgaceae bacterium]|nr:IclR family transcriptional regulator [Aestuariivirgaceae bacterium]
MAVLQRPSPGESQLIVGPEPPLAVDHGREPVAQRIVRTLEACAAEKRALTMTEIVEATGLAKTTVHRMCWRLVDLGLLEHSPEGFSIGTKMFALAGGSPTVSELRNAAIPHLIELQRSTGAMPHLAMITGGKALILDGLFTREAADMQRLVGRSLPLHCTAVGKAIAARLDPDERERLLFEKARLPFSTRRTILSPEALRKQLDDVIATGVAFSDQEYMAGVRAIAAGFRVHRDVTAAIGVMDSWNSHRMRGIPKLVSRAALELEHRLA